jgi:hypothetical protein
MNIAVTDTLQPIEIDARPCEHCGLTIARHRRYDTDEGPEFFCLPADEIDLDELELRAELIRQVEVAAIVRDMELKDLRDRWKHTGAPRPPENVRNSDISHMPANPRPRRIPQATIDAFKYVVSRGDPDHLARWLRDHSDTAAALLKEVGQC